MGEVWRYVPDWDGYYQVSNQGRVRSVERTAEYGTRSTKVKRCFQTWRGRILKLYLGRDGYHRVEFRRNGKRTSYLVSRLVAIAFLPNPLNKPQVNHKNGVRSDNRVHNLEWATGKENVRHAVESGLMPKGESKPTAVFCDSDIRKMRKMRNVDGLMLKEIAMLFKTDTGTVSKIARGLRWGHVS